MLDLCNVELEKAVEPLNELLSVGGVRDARGQPRMTHAREWEEGPIWETHRDSPILTYSARRDVVLREKGRGATCFGGGRDGSGPGESAPLVGLLILGRDGGEVEPVEE